MNSLTLCGHLGKDPELQTTTNGTPACKFSIADTIGKDKTQWFECVAYGPVAERIHQYFKKGKPIFVQGHMVVRTYEKRGGGTGVSIDVMVSSFEFVNIGSGDKSGSGNRKPQDPYEPEPPEEYRRGAANARSSAPNDMPDIADPFADQ
jgi:single-strand DNA-binding protein